MVLNDKWQFWPNVQAGFLHSCWWHFSGDTRSCWPRAPTYGAFTPRLTCRDRRWKMSTETNRNLCVSTCPCALWTRTCTSIKPNFLSISVLLSVNTPLQPVKSFITTFLLVSVLGSVNMPLQQVPVNFFIDRKLLCSNYRKQIFVYVVSFAL